MQIQRSSSSLVYPILAFARNFTRLNDQKVVDIVKDRLQRTYSSSILSLNGVTVTTNTHTHAIDNDTSDLKSSTIMYYPGVCIPQQGLLDRFKGTPQYFAVQKLKAMLESERLKAAQDLEKLHPALEFFKGVKGEINLEVCEKVIDSLPNRFRENFEKPYTCVTNLDSYLGAMVEKEEDIQALANQTVFDTVICDKLDDRELERRSKIQNIKILSIPRHNNISSKTFEAINAFTNLTHLYFNQYEVTDEDLKHLNKNEKMTHLDLGLCPKFTTVGLDAICERFPNMESIRLGAANKLGNEDIKLLAEKLKRLKKLSLGGCEKATDIPVLNPALDHLDLGGSSITNESLTKLRQPLKNLGLLGCDKITDKGLPALKQISTLRLLDLRLCMVSKYAIKDLQDHFGKEDKQYILKVYT